MLSDLNRVDFANVQVRRTLIWVKGVYVHAAAASLDSPSACAGAGAGILGVPVRGKGGSALGAGLQGHVAAAELPGAVGGLVGERGHSGAQAVRAPAQFPQSGSPVPAQVVLLQVCRHPNSSLSVTPP